MPDIYSFRARTIDGRDVSIGDWAGQVLLIGNTASKCGFTPQYAGLEALQKRFGPRGFAVLGFPCNQFASQEPGDEAEIANFCSLTYDVDFPMFAKIDVNGSDTHPLWQALKASAPGLMGTQGIKWNFTKFLVDRAGKVVTRFGPRDTPEALVPKIEALL